MAFPPATTLGVPRRATIGIMGPVPGATEAIALLLVYARPPLIGVPAAGADPHSHASVGSLPGVRTCSAALCSSAWRPLSIDLEVQ